MGSRRKFSKEFKLSVIEQLGSCSRAEICREHNILPDLLSRWKKEYDSNPHVAFRGKGKIWKENAKMVQYERIIGQLYAEITLLKKSLAHQTELWQEERRKRLFK